MNEHAGGAGSGVGEESRGDPDPRFATAMDAVRAAAHGDVSQEELFRLLLSWNYEPQYQTTGLTDDWEFRDNSFEAVEYAFINDLIDEGDYERIVRTLDGDGSEANNAGGSR